MVTILDYIILYNVPIIVIVIITMQLLNMEAINHLRFRMILFHRLLAILRSVQ